MRSIAISALALGLTAGCAASNDVESVGDSREAAQVPVQTAYVPTYEDVLNHGAPAKIVFGDRQGVLIIDASDGRVILDMPLQTLEFPSAEEFVDYARTKLNVEPVFDKGTGKLRGVAGRVEVAGNLVTVDKATKSVAAVADPIPVLLGGKAGYVKIAGQPYCLTEKCAAQLGQLAPQDDMPLEARVVCDGALCVTIATSPPENILNFRSLSSSTTAGDWGSWALCSFLGWFGIHVDSCPSNDLTVSTTFVKNDGTTWGPDTAHFVGVGSASVREWAIDWGFFGRTGEGRVFDTSGRCSTHTATRGSLSIGTQRTSDGVTHGQCH